MKNKKIIYGVLVFAILAGSILLYKHYKDVKETGELTPQEYVKKHNN